MYIRTLCMYNVYKAIYYGIYGPWVYIICMFKYIIWVYIVQCIWDVYDIACLLYIQSTKDSPTLNHSHPPTYNTLQQLHITLTQQVTP